MSRTRPVPGGAPGRFVERSDHGFGVRSTSVRTPTWDILTLPTVQGSHRAAGLPWRPNERPSPRSGRTRRREPTMHGPDDSQYSIAELEQALTGIDRRVDPDRVRRIERELARRGAPPRARAERPPVARGEVWTERPAFTGNGREYFGIWIVNLLLTVVTL